MISRAVPFVDQTGRLTPSGWLALNALATIPGPYADNAAALAGGLVAGDRYYTATGEMRVVV